MCGHTEVEDVENVAESSGMFDWFLNAFFFFFFLPFWRLHQYNQVFIFKGTKRSFSLTPLGGTVLSKWEHLVMQWPTCGDPCTAELVDGSTALIWFEGHVTAATRTAGHVQHALPPSGRTHQLAGTVEFGLFLQGFEEARSCWPHPLCRGTNQPESFVDRLPVFILIQKRLKKMKKIFKKLIQAASSIQVNEVSVADARWWPGTLAKTWQTRGNRVQNYGSCFFFRVWMYKRELLNSLCLA